MARNKIMKVWYWSLNSEWTYFIDDNTLAGGASSPLPLTYVNSSVAGEITILDDLLYTDFIDVSMIVLNPLFSPNGESLYFSNQTSFMLDDYVTCFDLASLASFSGVGSVDLTPVLMALSSIENRVNMLPDFEASSAIVSNALLSLDFSELNNLHEDIVSLGTELSTLKLPLQSLNGMYESYPDGTIVQIYPSSRNYTVESSFFFRNDTDQFVVMYWIVDSNGKKVSVPHNYLVIPVVDEGV